jgi:hypothetical protein
MPVCYILPIFMPSSLLYLPSMTSIHYLLNICQQTLHSQPYTIGWLRQGRDLCINQQCRLPYNIKPFKDEVLCDIAPLEVCDVLLGKPYLWKRHIVYESKPRIVIITLGRQLYKIPEVASPTAISLISAKQCSKVIS